MGKLHDHAFDLFLGACAADKHVAKRVRTSERPPEFFSVRSTTTTEHRVVRGDVLTAGTTEGAVVGSHAAGAVDHGRALAARMHTRHPTRAS